MNKLLKIIPFVAFFLIFISCSDELDGSYTPGSGDSSEIAGTWYGTSTYYNPVGGTKYVYLTITFNSNNTGSLEYEAPTSYSNAQFVYSVKGSTITCTGARANTDGDVETDFTLTLKKEGNRLIPQNKYTQFILTRDNSVLTNSEGKEVIDQSNLLQRYWMNTTGQTVLKFNKDTYDEYTLTSNFAHTYSSKATGYYSYDAARKILNLNGYEFTINYLTEDALSISGNSRTLTYKAMDPSDAPVAANGNNSDILAILTSTKLGWKTSNNNYGLLFTADNVYYTENSGRKSGSYGVVILSANGPYNISGYNIAVNYTDVFWEGGKDVSKDYFPGWTYGKSRVVYYTIESISYDKLVISDDIGHSFTMTPIK